MITELRVIPFLCAWNWSGSLGGSFAVLSLNRNESGGRKVQQLLGQTDMGILHFDNRIELRGVKAGYSSIDIFNMTLSSNFGALLCSPY